MFWGLLVALILILIVVAFRAWDDAAEGSMVPDVVSAIVCVSAVLLFPVALAFAAYWRRDRR
jgi:hypothetical protein